MRAEYATFGRYLVVIADDTVRTMRVQTLLISAGVLGGAIIGTHALLPDLYENPESDVAMENSRIPGQQCTVADGSSREEPKWECGETSVVGVESAPKDQDKALRRVLRRFSEGTEVPSGNVAVDGPKRVLEDAGLVAVSVEGPQSTSFLVFEGDGSNELAAKVAEA